MSVVATCRQRGRGVLWCLAECFGARLIDKPSPSRLGSGEAKPPTDRGCIGRDRLPH